MYQNRGSAGAGTKQPRKLRGCFRTDVENVSTYFFGSTFGS